MLHNITGRVWGHFKFLFYEIVLATFLVNGYPGVGGEFGFAGGENVEAAPPHKLPALAQVPHLGTRSCFTIFRTDDMSKVYRKPCQVNLNALRYL